jgi:hypothetical protein
MTRLTVRNRESPMHESEDSMTEIGFAPKEIIPQEVCQLEVMAADKADTYGPQIYLKLKVVGGEHDGHQFNDYANRDEETG